MPAAGRKPQDGPKHGRTPVAHDWVQVPDRPYRGRKPALPLRRPIVDRDGTRRAVPLDALTRAWWADISAMPHCVLWSKADWRFAAATALVADMFFQGDRQAAGELRLRERVLGTTVDARRDLRIRYVSPADEDPKPKKAKRVATVTKLDDRRARLLRAD